MANTYLDLKNFMVLSDEDGKDITFSYVLYKDKKIRYFPMKENGCFVMLIDLERIRDPSCKDASKAAQSCGLSEKIQSPYGPWKFWAITEPQLGWYIKRNFPKDEKFLDFYKNELKPLVSGEAETWMQSQERRKRDEELSMKPENIQEICKRLVRKGMNTYYVPVNVVTYCGKYFIPQPDVYDWLDLSCKHKRKDKNRFMENAIELLYCGKYTYFIPLDMCISMVSEHVKDRYPRGQNARLLYKKLLEVKDTPVVKIENEIMSDIQNIDTIETKHVDKKERMMREKWSIFEFGMFLGQRLKLFSPYYKRGQSCT